MSSATRDVLDSRTLESGYREIRGNEGMLWRLEENALTNYGKKGMIRGRYSNTTIPLEIQVLNRQAMEMSGHGHYRDALKIFSQVVFIAPHFARAQYEMGRCLECLGHFTDAVERYDKAIQLDPSIGG